MTTPYAKGLFQKGIVQSGATETMEVKFTSQEASEMPLHPELLRMQYGNFGIGYLISY